MSKTVKLILCLILPIVGFIFYCKDCYFSNTDQIDFEPFFRTDDSDPDFIPPFPELTDFDRGMLKVCGDWGSYPDEEDFRILLDCPNHQKIVEEIYDKLDHQVITPNANLELFKDELTKIWLTSIDNNYEGAHRTGFRHIFCGEPGKDKLGGMHFIGRYVEAQENKWAGAIWDNSICNKLDIKQPIFTLGIQYLNYDRTVKVKCPGGYDYDLHADDILILATKAFKELGRDASCLYKMEDNNYQLFGRRNNAIVTFYPDLEPKCDNEHVYCSCSQSE